MIPLAVICSFVAIVWTVVVCFANSMSDAQSSGFQGGETIALAWIGVILLWIAAFAGLIV